MFRTILTVLAIVTATNATALTQSEHNANITLFNLVHEYVEVVNESPSHRCATGEVDGAYAPAVNSLILCDGLDYDTFYENSAPRSCSLSSRLCCRS